MALYPITGLRSPVSPVSPVIRPIERGQLAAVEEYTARRLAEIGAAAVYEALGRRNALPPGIRPLWAGLVLRRAGLHG